MITLWITIVAVALTSAIIKAAGPVLIGGRDLPPRGVAILTLLAPALLAALVVTATFSDGQHLVLDERAIGVAVAGIALALRAPVLIAVALAVATTALARALLG